MTKKSIVLTLALLLVGFGSLAVLADEGQSQDQAPIYGTIISITQMDKSAVLVGLDTNADGQVDLKARLSSSSFIQGEGDQQLSLSDLQVGMGLELERYRQAQGYLDVQRAEVQATTNSSNDTDNDGDNGSAGDSDNGSDNGGNGGEN